MAKVLLVEDAADLAWMIVRELKAAHAKPRTFPGGLLPACY